MADPLIFAVNMKVWNSWTRHDQDVVRQGALEAGKLGIQLARKGLAAGDQSLVSKVRGLGVQVISLTTDQRQAFVDTTRGVYKKWTKKIGADLVKMAEESVANR